MEVFPLKIVVNKRKLFYQNQFARLMFIASSFINIIFPKPRISI